MIPYLICEFSEPTLSNLVKECFGSDFPDIFGKRQIHYIYRYLKDLKAVSVLLEFDYLDKDYLEDYSRYYVKCFSNNGHKCARLHFFSKEIDHTSLNELLLNGCDGEEMASLRESYLGFIVIKPLPKTFIGKTCLRNYPAFNSDGGNKRSLSREYKVDLFGISLKVNSIAFQEQDRVVSACATTAIWSSLHAMHWRTIRGIPACSIITTNAINCIDGSSNSFPNNGLSNNQILRALDLEKLRHHEESLSSISKEDFFDSARCYIDSKLPLILGVDVYQVDENRKLKILAGHAVTILGYQSYNNDKAIYIHDDRLGPFARATLVSLEHYNFSESTHKEWGLLLQEKNDKGEWNEAHEVLIPNSLIIPTPQKVRLKSELARNTCNFMKQEYEKWLRSLTAPSANENFGQIKFSIRIEEISEIRQDLIKHKYDKPIGAEKENSPPLSCEDIQNLGKQKTDFLTGSYARFQWVSRFYYKDIPAFRILFDATDIPQGDAVSFIFIEDKYSSDAILSIFKQYALSPLSEKISDQQNLNFYGSVLKFLRKKDSNFSEYLDTTYGELRAPKYLKLDEFSGGRININESMKRYYDSIDVSLDSLFPDVIENDNDSVAIWAIAHDGALLIGVEVGQKGHPTLTGFKPARIAGELRKTSNGWGINAKSGRYSGDYRNENDFLTNAMRKFQSVFHLSRDKIYCLAIQSECCFQRNGAVTSHN